MSILKKIILTFAIIYTSYIMIASVYFLWTTGSSAQSYPPKFYPPTPPISVPPPKNFCLSGVKNITYHDRCGKQRNLTYKKANYRCVDSSRGEFRSKNCLTEAEFYRAAYQSCSNMSKCLSPTVSPTPQYNSPPVITSGLPPVAEVGVDFSAYITAVDKDKDPLNMQIDGLPPGITQGPCQLNAEPITFYPISTGPIPPIRDGYISCNISGIPTESGYFWVTVSVTDHINEPVYQGYSLAVGPFPTPYCPTPPPCRGGNLINGDPAPSSGSTCPLYYCIQPTLLPGQN